MLLKRYPYNLDFEYGALEGLEKFSINNLGDPFIESNYGVHSREFEVRTHQHIQILAVPCCLYLIKQISDAYTCRLESCNGLRSFGRLIVRITGGISPTVEQKAIYMAFL